MISVSPPAALAPAIISFTIRSVLPCARGLPDIPRIFIPVHIPAETRSFCRGNNLPYNRGRELYRFVPEKRTGRSPGRNTVRTTLCHYFIQTVRDPSRYSLREARDERRLCCTNSLSPYIGKISHNDTRPIYTWTAYYNTTRIILGMKRLLME